MRAEFLMHYRLARVSTIAVLRLDDEHGPRNLEQTPSVRIDSFADCEYWSTLLSIFHQGSTPFP